MNKLAGMRRVPTMLKMTTMFRGAMLIIAFLLFSETVPGQDVSADGNVSLRLIATLAGHTDHVRDIEFSSDRTLLASCGQDGTIRLWNIDTKEQVTSIKVQEKTLYAIAFSPDGKTLATGGRGGTVTLWNVRTHSKINSFPMPGLATVLDITWSPDGKTVVVHSWAGIVLIHASDGKSQLVTFDDALPSPLSMAMSPDGKRIVVGGNAATLAVWGRSQKRILAKFEALPKDASNLLNLSSLVSLAFSPNEDLLAVSSGFKIPSTVTLWNPTKKVLKRKFAGDHDTVWCVSFSPDGRLLAGAGDGLVLWDVPTGKVHSKWRPSPKPSSFQRTFHAYSIAFSRNGVFLASGGSDNTVKLFAVVKSRVDSHKNVPAKR